MEELKFDFTKEFSQGEIDFLDKLLFKEFHMNYNKKFVFSEKDRCKTIIQIRKKLGLDVDDNMMNSDYELDFNEEI